MEFDIVKKHIDELDPIGLLEIGAPLDEYECEVAEIVSAMNNRKTKSEVANAIIKIFDDSFGEHNLISKKDANYIAEIIFNEINLLKGSNAEEERITKRKYDEVILTALPLIANEPKVSLDIKQKLGLSYFYKSNYEKSLAIFEEIAIKKRDVESWFNVLMSLMSLSKVQRGKEVFANILSIHEGLTGKQPRELAIPFIRYYYACGLNDVRLFSEALEQLQELKNIYM